MSGLERTGGASDHHAKLSCCNYFNYLPSSRFPYQALYPNIETVELCRSSGSEVRTPDPNLRHPNLKACGYAYRPQRSCHIFSPIRQGTRGSLWAAGTTRCSGVVPATSSVSLVRIASLNLSRSLIETTKEPGPPMTQSS